MACLAGRRVTGRLFAPTADGETVPLSLLHRKNLMLVVGAVVATWDFLALAQSAFA